jgi:uncharacterized membrane protein
MTLLIAGLILFLGLHSVRIVADGWRTQTLARVGEKTWKLSYTVVSIVGFALIVWGYGQARQSPTVLWEAPAWGAKATGALMLASLTLLAGAYVPGSKIKSVLHHPMLWSVLVFAVAHLLANNTLADVLLFGGFGLWAALDLASCYARDRAAGTQYASAKPGLTAINVVVGLAIWAAFAFWLHLVLIGVSPIPRR